MKFFKNCYLTCLQKQSLTYVHVCKLLYQWLFYEAVKYCLFMWGKDDVNCKFFNESAQEKYVDLRGTEISRKHMG
jgi:hypothetical protein